MDTTLRDNTVSIYRNSVNMDTTLRDSTVSIDRNSVNMDTTLRDNTVSIDGNSVNMDTTLRDNTVSIDGNSVNMDTTLRDNTVSIDGNSVNMDTTLRDNTVSIDGNSVNMDTTLRDNTVSIDGNSVNMDTTLRDNTVSIDGNSVNMDTTLRDNTVSIDGNSVNMDTSVIENKPSADSNCVKMDGSLRENTPSAGTRCVNVDFPLREDTLSAGTRCVNMDFPLREDTLRQAREARCDQGIHEVEVSFNAESDLQHAFIMCDKNPGHQNYIPVNEISLDKFPESVQDNAVLEFIKIKAKETVRLTCNLTSQARPAGYTFHKYRGSPMLRCGSGRVMGVFKDKIQTDISCPFIDCQEKQGPHTVSGYIKIHTANHVVFDDAEAQRTFVDFFYDIPNDRSTVVTARGYKVVKSDMVGDYCVMDCVTHDPDLCTTLDTIRQQWSSKWPNIEKHLYDKNVSVAISHPHGCSKQFSIGSFVRREFEKVGEDQYWYRYTYKAATCPGCSGAPVWVGGGQGLPSSYAPHSGHEGNSVNRSTVWFFWKPHQDNT